VTLRESRLQPALGFRRGPKTIALVGSILWIPDNRTPREKSSQLQRKAVETKPHVKIFWIAPSTLWRPLCPLEPPTERSLLQVGFQKPTNYAVYLHSCFRGLHKSSSHRGCTSRGNPKHSPQKNPGPCVSNETCTLPGFRRGRRVE
jgi:hypothetical protein